MKLRMPLPFFILISLMSLLIFYQNCQIIDSLQRSSVTQTSIFRSSSVPVLQGVIDSNCMNSLDYNACIFLKNPVAQNAAPFNHPITFSTDLSFIQTYGVNLVGMTNNYLQNSTYNVLIDWNDAQRTQVNSEGAWKFEYANDPHHNIAQVMTYYWLTYQMSYMQKKAGKWYAENKDVQVYALSSQLKNDAYFSSIENKIAFGYFNLKGKIEAALSADIILHEAAHASFYHSNPQRNPLHEATHKKCSSSGENFCCQSYRGCFKAINEGQADFHSLIVFSSLSSSIALQPLIGEGVTNEFNLGLGNCVERHMEHVKDTSAIAAYNGCGFNSELRGEIHTMGTLYASIWWNIYTSPFVVQDEVIQLFVEHLPLVSSEDTFETVGRRILNIDRQIFHGKYAGIITRAFTERGLSLSP